MKKLGILLLSLVFMILLANEAAIWLVNRSEAASYNQSWAYCEMLNIGMALNEEFLSKEIYPQLLIQSETVAQLEGVNVCRGELRASNGGFLDPWGAPYIYRRISGERAVISSSRGLRIYLVEGKIQLESNNGQPSS